MQWPSPQSLLKGENYYTKHLSKQAMTLVGLLSSRGMLFISNRLHYKTKGFYIIDCHLTQNFAIEFYIIIF